MWYKSNVSPHLEANLTLISNGVPIMHPGSYLRFRLDYLFTGDRFLAHLDDYQAGTTTHHQFKSQYT